MILSTTLNDSVGSVSTAQNRIYETFHFSLVAHFLMTSKKRLKKYLRGGGVFLNYFKGDENCELKLKFKTREVIGLKTDSFISSVSF